MPRENAIMERVEALEAIRNVGHLLLFRHWAIFDRFVRGFALMRPRPRRCRRAKGMQRAKYFQLQKIKLRHRPSCYVDAHRLKLTRYRHADLRLPSEHRRQSRSAVSQGYEGPVIGRYDCQ